MLALGGGVAGIAMAGCHKAADAPGSETAHEILSQLLAMELALLRRYSTNPPAAMNAETLAALIADHESHAEALRNRLPKGASPSISAPPSTAASALEIELAAAQYSTRLCVKAPSSIGDVAELSASLSACEYSHVVSLGGSYPREPDSPLHLARDDVRYAQNTLSGIHAAIYAYSVVGARIAQTDLREHVRQTQQRHRERRDVLADAIAEHTDPRPAEPAYQLPTVDNDTAAFALAIRVEQDVAAAWRALTPRLSKHARRVSLDALCESANEAAHWRRTRGMETIPAGSANPPNSLGTVPWPGA